MICFLRDRARRVTAGPDCLEPCRQPRRREESGPRQRTGGVKSESNTSAPADRLRRLGAAPPEASGALAAEAAHGARRARARRVAGRGVKSESP